MKNRSYQNHASYSSNVLYKLIIDTKISLLYLLLKKFVRKLEGGSVRATTCQSSRTTWRSCHHISVPNLKILGGSPIYIQYL